MKMTNLVCFFALLNTFSGTSAYAKDDLDRLLDVPVVVKATIDLATELSSKGDTRVLVAYDSNSVINMTKLTLQGINPETDKACEISLQQNTSKDTLHGVDHALILSVEDLNPDTDRHYCDETNEATYGECMRDLKAPKLEVGISQESQVVSDKKNGMKIRQASAVPYRAGSRNEAVLSFEGNVIVLKSSFIETPFKLSPKSKRIYNWSNVRSSDSMTCKFIIKN